MIGIDKNYHEYFETKNRQDVLKSIILPFSKRKLKKTFKEISRRFNLNVRIEKWFGFPEVSGPIDDLFIEIKLGYKGSNADTMYEVVQLKLEFENLLSEDFAIRNETFTTKDAKSRGIDDILIGDQTFDECIYLESDPEHYMYALLSERVRKYIMAIFNKSIYLFIDKHIFVVCIDTKFLKSAVFFINIIKAMVFISQQFKNIDKDIKYSLIQNSIKDSLIQIRLKNIECIGIHFDTDNEVRDCFRKLLDDEDNRIQFQAAKFLRKDGIKHMYTNLISHELKDDELLLEIIAYFNENKVNRGFSQIISLFKKTDNIPLKILLSKALSHFKNKDLCSFLISQIELNDAKVKKEIIKTLGIVGTINEVQFLYDFEHKFLNTPSMRNTARQAIAKIQSRYEGGDKGMLSVAETSQSEGSLSILDTAQDGSLSINEDD